MFEILFETRPRQSKSGLETVSRRRRRDQDFIPADNTDASRAV